MSLREENNFDRLMECIREEKIKVVSFDIFDTLLIRPVSRPTDLFRLIEKKTGEIDFGERRRAAEKFARASLEEVKGEIEITDIYNEYMERFCIGQERAAYLEKIEIQTEWEALECRNSIKTIYNAVSQLGKEIIITSDMYLSKAFLEKVLIKNGYMSHEQLFVSSDIKKTKKKGTLYEYITRCYEERDICRDNIFHIGDNFANDVERAKKIGWKAFYYPKTVEVFMQEMEKMGLKEELRLRGLNEYEIGKVANRLFDNPFTVYSKKEIFTHIESILTE